MASGYKKSIEDFKGVLKGGGVRPTMFEVRLSYPEGVSSQNNDQNAAKTGSDVDTNNKASMLVKAAQLPASNVGNIEVPFRGRKFKVSGDRSFDNWTITVINDRSFKIRKSMEKWSELIQNHNYALGLTDVTDYMQDAQVIQLDRDASPLRTYEFRSIWPVAISDISLDAETTNTIEEYTVEFAVQYWSAANTTNGDVPNRLTAGVAGINQITS